MPCIEIDNRELAYQRTLQEVNADLVTIFRTYENNLRLLEMEYENLETARENMEIAFERYRLGALSGIELREVQVSLLDAEERLLGIQYQTKLAEISLLQISGPDHGIHISITLPAHIFFSSRFSGLFSMHLSNDSNTLFSLMISFACLAKR
jgi:hypothetical protein